MVLANQVLSQARSATHPLAEKPNSSTRIDPAYRVGRFRRCQFYPGGCRDIRKQRKGRLTLFLLERKIEDERTTYFDVRVEPVQKALVAPALG